MLLTCSGVYNMAIRKSSDSPYEYSRLDTGLNISKVNGISIYKSSLYYKGEFNNFLLRRMYTSAFCSQCLAVA